ncbi:hypothetical protein T4B_4530 [Trichinella pseudospiralis]|uniref:Uncharacterized protein n=1 Tax=Trichinella pseudospiralis TaxID=6337 RepID=A0A0V1GLL6_TRIPS|nr:hypothetical protein T4B_4530 [Trichinella pseudospiralis]
MEVLATKITVLYFLPLYSLEDVSLRTSCFGAYHQYHICGGTDQGTEISRLTNSGIRTSGRLHCQLR